MENEWNEREIVLLKELIATELGHERSTTLEELCAFVSDNPVLVDWTSIQQHLRTRSKEECYRKSMEMLNGYIPIGIMLLFKCDEPDPEVFHVTFDMTVAHLRKHAQRFIETQSGVILQVEQDEEFCVVPERDDGLLIAENFGPLERIYCHAESNVETHPNFEMTISIQTPHRVLKIPRHTNMRIGDLMDAIVDGEPQFKRGNCNEQKSILLFHPHHGVLHDRHLSICVFQPALDFTFAHHNRSASVDMWKLRKRAAVNADTDSMRNDDNINADHILDIRESEERFRTSSRKCKRSRGEPSTNPRKKLKNSEKSKPHLNSTDEDVVDDNLTLECCCNCRRTKPENNFDPVPVSYMFNVIMIDLNHLVVRNNQREFCMIDFASFARQQDGSRPAPICGQCYAHLSVQSSTRSDPASHWPVFVWKLLADESIQHRVWGLLPVMFRKWWIRSFSVMTNVKKSILMAQETKFLELTAETDGDIFALKSLRWGEDTLPREMSLTLPVVKCPAGCSEWKHRSNSLPMDIVFEFILDKELPLHSSKDKRHCKRWFRDDYLQREILFLNPNWICQPTIAFCKETGAPTVLCCRDHSSTKKTAMLHPCRHPGATISTEKASQFTPVVSCPRTIRKACFSKCSASFHVAKMEGSYNGLDTMSLMAGGGWHHHQQKLAWEQEVLAVNGRKDLKAHTCKLSCENKLAAGLASSLIDARDEMYPNWETKINSAKAGGTYVSMDDAMRMHQNMFYDRNESGFCVNQNSGKKNWFIFVALGQDI